ncbi:hypothetical protein RHSIM_Rhsim07G0229400 [Rhododendron simsii]|uniref:EF-hand domain-containing protein n=1 Tax=Rhododendron simsii TaxID=118357 RepID=A0A834GTF9_RHOSS|nr:hypothetical protein RHSIM_Rhsim07G0229400 [Rhododendron simsii]
MPIQCNSDRNGGPGVGKIEMTMDEFKVWTMRFDKDKDGRINRDELQQAIRTIGAWFPGWKASRGVKFADANGDGFIDDNGRLSRDELKEGIRCTRAWLPGWKDSCGVKVVDANGDGFIDDTNSDSREMAIDEFKMWVKQFDVDKDGRISRDELKEAIRANRAWFPGWKANRGVKAADVNGDGFIDDSEITALVEFAEKNFNIKIMP